MPYIGISLNAIYLARGALFAREHAERGKGRPTDGRGGGWHFLSRKRACVPRVVRPCVRSAGVKIRSRGRRGHRIAGAGRQTPPLSQSDARTSAVVTKVRSGRVVLRSSGKTRR